MVITDFWTTDRRSLLRAATLLTLVPRPARAAWEPTPALWQALVETILDYDSADLHAPHAESQGLGSSQIAERLHSFMQREPEALRDMLFGGVSLLGYSGWLSGYPGHFATLPLAQRRTLYRGWLSSSLPPIQTLAMALRSAALFLWFSDPASWSAIGYTGPWVAREGLRP